MKSFNINIILIMVFLTFVGIIVNCKTKKIYFDNQEFIDNLSLSKYIFIIELFLSIVIACILFIITIIVEAIIKNGNINIFGLGILFLIFIFWGTLVNILYLILWKNGTI